MNSANKNTKGGLCDEIVLFFRGETSWFDVISRFRRASIPEQAGAIREFRRQASSLMSPRETRFIWELRQTTVTAITNWFAMPNALINQDREAKALEIGIKVLDVECVDNLIELWDRQVAEDGWMTERTRLMATVLRKLGLVK